MSIEKENSFDQDDRPRKRRRTSIEASKDFSPTCQQIALEEIDLEISIRQRISEITQSRLEWAQLLQQSLQKSVPKVSESFRSASLDALEAIEEPCHLIINREVRLSLPALPVPVVAPPPSTASTILPDPVQPPLAGGRSTRTRGLARTLPTTLKRLLFLRNTSTTPPEIAKLACPACSRSDFSNLQGLLNHCRLRHQLEYGSHDECIQRCAVLVPQEERDWVISNGIELGGISLPSLRRLFEIAVGAGEGLKLPPLPTSLQPTSVKTEALDAPLPSPQPTSLDEPAVTSGAHVTRTLGYHADTPALAPFLGRAPQKRRVNVRANQEDFVNIEDHSEGSGVQPRTTWRKPYTHRNIARQELDEVIPLSDLPTKEGRKPDEHATPAANVPSEKDVLPELHVSSRTRFHIVARVQVADYSVPIPPNRRLRERPEHTHRWRLAVTSPSYSLPISSVLRQMTITSVTDPPPSTLLDPITVSEPPFIITSTTERPFLARLVFTWVGSMNPPTEIEHWVELDPMQHASAVLGDEQVFDVELDRQTELLPAREDVREVSWDDAFTDYVTTEDPISQRQEEPEAEYAMQLRSLLPRFPMTMKDVKGKLTTLPPYTLVSTPTQFRNLTYGRRKAIEMGRARAIYSAYQGLASHAHGAGTVSLTVIDVFHWLEDESCFIRPDAKKTGLSLGQHVKNTKSAKNSKPQLSSDDSRASDFCRVCGLQRFHHLVSSEDPEEDKQPSAVRLSKPTPVAMHGLDLQPLPCVSFCEEDDASMRPPIIDVDQLLDHSAPTIDSDTTKLSVTKFAPLARLPSKRSLGAGSEALLRFSSGDLVAIADPHLVSAILRMTGLPFLQRPPIGSRTHLVEFGACSTELATSEDARTSPDRNLRPDPLDTNPITNLGVRLLQEPRATVDAHLGSSSMLSLAVQAFVQRLVGHGVDELRRDDAAALSVSVVGGRHRHERRRRGMTPSGGPAQRVLTPSHVLRGLAHHAQADVANSALLLSVSRLGSSSSLLSE